MTPFRLATLLLCLLPGLALAQDETVVTQSGKQFSTDGLTIERGQTVTFVNADGVRHNIALRTPDGRDRTGIVQNPGESSRLTFDQPGLNQIHCLIHPAMRLAVTVK